ncbi:esterase-like activity of phytase family protein [Mycobacterium sp.]|uniref:esterase-like activity of phytase family protein n=1 Tax=Mycobacterium sp. TaxID=1785 RepID=UPI003BA9BD4B
MSRLVALCCLLLVVPLAGCGQARRAGPVHRPEPPKTAGLALSYLGQRTVASDATFDGTVIGGLSGISYDPGRQLYYVISDDRSDKNPVRFYTVRLSLSDRGIDDVLFTGTHPLLDRSGQRFGPLNTDSDPPVAPPDPEGIAFDKTRQQLYWCSEGARIIDVPVLLDPWVRTAGLNGGYKGEFTLPPNLAMSAKRTGPRRNRGLEGLTLTPDGRWLFTAMEDPGYNDGPEANGNQPVLTRITKFDPNAPLPVAQYAYPMEPPAGSADRNGVSDLVALSDATFLVLERTPALPPVTRIFRAEIGSATDVLAMPSMLDSPLTAMSKSLVVDLAATPGLPPVANIEGITLGPTLPDGRQSVVMVSDNDFSPIPATSFLLFALS